MFKTFKSNPLSINNWDEFIGLSHSIYGKCEPLTFPPISIVEMRNALHNILYGRESKEQIKSGIIKNYLERTHYILSKLRFV